MTKNELADDLARRTNFTKSQALRAIDGLSQGLFDAIAKGDNIYLRGFGTFKIEQRAARKARDVRSNKMIDVPAKKVVKFIPCVELKNKVK